MGRYMLPVLSSWVIVMLYAEGSFAAAHYDLQAFPSENGWSDYSSAGGPEWEGTERSALGAPATSNSSIVTLEESRQSSAINASGTSGAEIGGARGLLRTGKAAFSPFTARKLSSSLALLFVVSLLTVCLKSRIFPKKEEVPITEEPVEAEEPAEGEQLVRELERRAQTEARLKKVKALLPVAARLASAIGTEESVRLLTAVQGALRATDWTAGAADNGELEQNLKRALGALRWLHHAGIKRGNEILKASKDLAPVAPLGIFEGSEGKVELEWREGKKDITVAPFAAAYQAVHESAARLFERFTDARRRLTADRRFENEEDGEVLIDLALVLESMGTTAEDFKHLSRQAPTLKDGIYCGIKTWLLAARESAVVTLEGDLTRYRLYAALARDALNGEAEAQTLSGDEVKAALDIMEKSFIELESLVDQMKTGIGRLRESATLITSVGIAGEVDSLRNRAEEVLQNCSTAREAFSGLVLRLSPSSVKILNDLAEKSVQRVKLVNEKVRSVVSSAQLSIKGAAAAYGVSVKERRRYLKETVYSGLLEALNDAASESQASVTDVQASQTKLKRLTTLSAVLEETSWLNYLVRTQEQSMARALSGLLRVHLADFFEEDAKVSERAVRVADLRSSHLTEVEKPKYADAVDRFNAASEAAKEADTLEEASEAVGQMRQRAIGLSDIVYRYTAADSQPE